MAERDDHHRHGDGLVHFVTVKFFIAPTAFQFLQFDEETMKECRHDSSMD